MGRALLAGIAIAVALPAFLELGFRLAVEGGFLDTPRPGGVGQGLWQGHHPDYGVWHQPGISARHVSRCFDVEVRTNSLGARDIERSRESDRPRAIFLGDSFSEGWGVPEAERLSNRLETASGFEHLNFAIPKSRLSFHVENPRNVCARALFNHLIGVVEIVSQALREHFSNCALTNGHETYKIYILIAHKKRRQSGAVSLPTLRG